MKRYVSFQSRYSFGSVCALAFVLNEFALASLAITPVLQTTTVPAHAQQSHADTPELNQALSKAERTYKSPANPALPTLWIIGDSTVRNGQGDGANGQWGWGDEIAPYFDTSKINIVNRALGGRSSRTFYTQNWRAVLALIRSGDFLMMQFGHNDGGPLDDPARSRGTLAGTGEETREINNPLTHQHETVHTFGWYEKQMIEQARQRGATIIVCSLIPRKIFVENKINRDKYADWAADVARKENVAFIDLNRIVADQYNRMGPGKVEPLFADPHTHTTLAGAELNARAVVQGLKTLHSDPLAKYLSTAGNQVPPSS